MQNIGERVKLIREPESRPKFAVLTGVSKNTLENYETGASHPNSEYLNKLLDLYPDINPAWLLRGEGAMKRGDVRWNDRGPDDESIEAENALRRSDDQYCSIPLYDVSASAGHGALVEREQVVDFLHFKRSWVKTTLLASPGDLYLIHVQGDSMIPTLTPGDVILVDSRSRNAVTGDGIYVLQLDGTLLVKRLQRMPGNCVTVTSDNSIYQPMQIQLDRLPLDFTIVGRVVWYGRRV
jgi:phage repressor protein C with HTH and peptisase S24 domain